MSTLRATVVGGGILGLWQAFELARRGHAVTLHEAMPALQTGSASRVAGAMLAPYCEAEGEPVVEELGLAGLALWRETFPGTVVRGSLIVAGARDQSEIGRFARATTGHRFVDAGEIAALEPDLASRFMRGLYYEQEAHVEPRAALAHLVAELRRLGARLHFGSPLTDPLWLAAGAGEVVIDCRGLGGRHELENLRGVRGEMAVLRTREIALSRPVRLLHPRFPLYVVPWGDHRYMVGATVIERDDAGPVTARSALDLLGTAYALHPAFGEAEIIELSVGVRPSLPDNLPRIIVRGRRIIVNGAYRHGYLLAPALAVASAGFLETGAVDERIMMVDR